MADTNTNTYKCAACGGVFGKGWSDREAAAEAKDLWGRVPASGMVVVCDTCFKRGAGAALAERSASSAKRPANPFGFKRITEYDLQELDLAVSIAREHCEEIGIDFYAILRGVDAHMEKRRRKTRPDTP
jgi:hypothetical protein